MKSPFILSLAALLVLINSCGQPPAPKPAATTEITADSHYKDAEYTVQAILYHQFGSEYRALCYQAYNLATERLLAKVKANPKGKLAIITDLDETVVDNSYYNTKLVNEGAMYTPETWKQWTAQKKATLIPGSLEFFKMADSLEVTIFYISNRGTDEYAPTLANLEELGLPQLDSSHFYLKTTTSGKEDRRQAVSALGYTVVMLLGDNLNDFSNAFEKQNNERRQAVTDSLKARFGKDYIVFPNAIYGEWEVALYDYNHKLTNIQKDSIRKSVLK
ncbi:5'-nucleotidase, lipoprotein e(P4) family [soil metagenome]